ncbi:hypothetical protein EV643_107173 [Kribbella sp. VKM Ac-2527]|uniref:AMIN-like domain-containing protein n=1 Tax=Kribbella caucasensis TaxID=2512215 RepID=A0A4R6KHD7_9ACTN|nr:hypothetical protein [Kribbella sp. VKM Ac-2527]TDO48544.1 hypothetical protein EV643_107173 [Kribbella sp. VKM Ac-2527]
MNTIHNHRRSIRTALAVLAVAALPAAAVAVPTAFANRTTNTTASQTATTTSCPTGWGSLREANSRFTAAAVTNVRTGRHACFDRIVIDLAGKPTGYDVSYVSNVYQDGSGFLVPLRGGAKIQLIVHGPAYDDAGRSTYNPANHRELTNVTGYRTLRQLASAGSFEGQTTIGVGVRARLPFRVFTLTGPGSGSRVVVDVAHTW